MNLEEYGMLATETTIFAILILLAVAEFVLFILPLIIIVIAAITKQI